MRGIVVCLAAWIAATPAIIPATLAAEPAASPPATRPLVVELFTSEGCSSCPPADALLGELARDHPDLLPLAFHVTYWDRLGWLDPYGLQAATARQRAYAAALPDGLVYTPELVVDGRQGVVGSDRAAVAAALRAAAADMRAAVAVRLTRLPGAIGIALDAGPMPGGSAGGKIWLVGFDREHRTAVGGGENGGRVLREANVVRSLTAVGKGGGAGQRATWRLPAPAGEDFAAFVQADDGRILGAARLPPP